MAQKKESWNPLLRSYPESRKINSVSIGAETMFTRLIASCDDASNYYGEPSLMLCHLYGRRFAQGEVSDTDTARWRDELVTATLLVCYVVDSETYVHIVNCKKMLRKDINADIRFPKFDPSTQVLIPQGRNESVTDTARTRNENVSPSSPSASPSASPSLFVVSLKSESDRDGDNTKPSPTTLFKQFLKEWNNVNPKYVVHLRSTSPAKNGTRLAKFRTRIKDNGWLKDAYEVLRLIDTGKRPWLGGNDRGNWKLPIGNLMKNSDVVSEILEGKYSAVMNGQDEGVGFVEGPR